MAQIALHEKRRAILVTTSVFGQQIRTRETKKKNLIYAIQSSQMEGASKCLYQCLGKTDQQYSRTPCGSKTHEKQLRNSTNRAWQNLHMAVQGREGKTK